MPRQKLSEYRAKTILSKALQQPYIGWSIDTHSAIENQVNLQGIESLVVKVDEGVKGRFKKGLVLLDVEPENIAHAVKTLKDHGFRWLIIEPMLKHDRTHERYMSLLSNREGLTLQYTSSGGIDVEQHANQIKRVAIDEMTDWDELAKVTMLNVANLHSLVDVFQENYFVFLEINPYLTANNNFTMLDAAVEVDDAAAFFVNTWDSKDFRRHTSHTLLPQELTVQELDANSPASLKLSVLEPDGSIFLLLSGGGASVVVADEVYNQGYGRQLANYGEYSGNPNTEETYLYTKAVLELVLASAAPSKVIFIGGAVANFTDIAKTFAGIIHAIDDVAAELRKQKVKIFVRRGGPNQEVGLARLSEALTKHTLLGAVHDPSTPLTIAVGEALQEVNHD